MNLIPANKFEKENVALLDLIVSQFKLDIKGDHGINHWRKVYEISIYLAEEIGADITVVSFFAYLHDAKREDDVYDLQHGHKASDFIKELHSKHLLPLSEDQLERLEVACKFHADSGIKSNDITIQTCWDADRLDLWRVGVVPDKKFLNTDLAKQDKVMKYWCPKIFKEKREKNENREA
jgi:uncharacterized protein